jgi:tetratricopeptide (TPR) repeat protein
MRQRLLVRVALVAALCSTTARVYAAEPCAANLAAESLFECETGRQSSDRSERERRFARGLELAEQAIRLDQASAASHFALFCNQGEIMRIDGESIRDVLELRSLLSELDRTLELDPNHPGALSAKGTFLVRLPRLLGGDIERGEAMLRRVLTLDPTAVTARIGLARVCEYRGQRNEGLAYARRALQFAKELGRADKVVEAQAILAQFGETH